MLNNSVESSKNTEKNDIKTKKKVVRKPRKKVEKNESATNSKKKEVLKPVIEETINSKVLEPIIEEEVQSVKEETTEPIIEDTVKEEVLEPIIENAVKEKTTEPIIENTTKEEVLEPISEETIKEETVEPVVKEQKKKVVKKRKTTDKSKTVKKSSNSKSKEEVVEAVNVLKPVTDLNDIIIETSLEDIEKKIDNNYVEPKTDNNYIQDLIKENINKNILEEKENIKDKNLETKINNSIDNLKKNIITEYTTNDVKDYFSKIEHSAILVQVINNKLYYLEKKCSHNKNIHILNILYKMTSKFLINDSTFIIDTSDEIKNSENFVLRFNRNIDDKNLLLVNYNLDYNLNNLQEISWEYKKNKIYVNNKYVSEDLYNKLKLDVKNDLYEFVEDDNIEKINEYKYVIYEKTNNNINYEVDLLRLNVILFNIVTENSNKSETYYSEYFNDNSELIKINIDNQNNIDNLISKNKLESINHASLLNNLKNKSEYVFGDKITEDYMKNLLSRLSLKCETKQIINNKIFITNKDNNYLYNRIDVEDNKFNFNFQGKDFDILLIDNNDNKINILINQFVTNIFYNGKNIFNYRIPSLVSNRVSSNFSFMIRNKLLYLSKNKVNPILGCRIPEIFNIEKVALRTFNKDSWWIC